jgi:hypothetical protein
MNPPSSQERRRPGTLPSFAELTTGVSVLSAPAYAMPPGRSPSGTVSPRPGLPHAPPPPPNGYGPSYYYQTHFEPTSGTPGTPHALPPSSNGYRPPSYYETPLEPMSGTPGKRRASPEEMVRERSRRRHSLDTDDDLVVRRQLESDRTPPTNTKDV